jgi:nucleoside-diphosphate-sugar epimerase
MRQPNGAFWAGRSVVVTGGAGFVGQALIHDLEPLGADIRVVRSAQPAHVSPAAYARS